MKRVALLFSVGWLVPLASARSFQVGAYGDYFASRKRTRIWRDSTARGYKAFSHVMLEGE